MNLALSLWVLSLAQLPLHHLLLLLFDIINEGEGLLKHGWVELS